MDAGRDSDVQSPFAGKGLGQPHPSLLSVSVKDTLSSLKHHDSHVFDQDTGSAPSHKAARKLRKSLSPKIRTLKNLFIFNPLKPLQREKHGPKTPPVQEVAQPSAPSEQDSSTFVQQEESLSVVGSDRDLFVQVTSAKGLRAADLNGLSDPYCVVRLGKTKCKTQVIKEELNPNWNETFVFPAKEVQNALMTSPIIVFEVWDSDTLSDDFLGQAELDLTQAPLHTSRVEPQHMKLYAIKQGKQYDGSLGQLEAAVWLAPTGHFGRVHHDAAQGMAGRDNSGSTTLLSLCSPPGMGKQLPYTISAGGNTLFEEPCICYLPLVICKIRCKDKGPDMGPEASSGSWTNMLQRMQRPSLASAGGSGRKGATSQKGGTPKRASWKDRAQPTLRRGSVPGLSRGASPSGHSDEGPDDDDDDQQGQSPNASPHSQTEMTFPADNIDEAEPTEFGNDIDPASDDAPHKLKGRTLLYYEVALAGQKHRSRLSKLQEGCATWDQQNVFLATLPLRNRALKLRVYLTDSNKRRGRLVAHAFIPLRDVLPQTREEVDSGHRSTSYFRLHEEPGEANRMFRSAAVKLGMAVVDADVRRKMYQQPLIETVTGGERQLLHELSRAESEHSVHASGMLPGDLNHDFENVSRAVGVRQGEAGALAGESVTRSKSDVSTSSALHDDATSRPSSSGRRPEDGQAAGRTTYAASFRRPANSRLQALLQPIVEVQQELAGRLPRTYRCFAVLWACFVAVFRWPAWLLLWPVLWVVGAVRARLPARPKRPPEPLHPMGLVKLLLEGVELENAEPVFCVLKCGPHWGRSATIQGTKTPSWHWEVHLPLYDPDTMLLLAVFSEPGKGRLFNHGGPQLVAKLRVRLSTVAANRWHECRLPLMAERKQGGGRKATAHLGLEVVFFKPWGYLTSYAKARMPSSVYAYALEGGLTGKWLVSEERRIVLRWLDAQTPPHTLPRLVAKGLLDKDREEFTMSRARANWRRVAIMRNKMQRLVVAFRYVQSWRKPYVSLGAMVALTTLSFHPHVVISLVLLSLAVYAWVNFDPESGTPLSMEADPEAEEDNEEVSSSIGNPYTMLKQRYERLLEAALAVQSAVDDVAQMLERLHATISWEDPHATAIFVAFGFVAAVAVVAIPWPIIQAVALCWSIRPPFMRSPTPPLPISFFQRLPTKADQIM